MQAGLRKENKMEIGAVSGGLQAAVPDGTQGSGFAREISFAEILLDETLAQGDIWVLKEALSRVGGINYRLGAKRNYELLIRIAEKYKVLQADWEVLCRQPAAGEMLDKEWVCLKAETGDDASYMQAAVRTDCYLIGRYKEELLSMESFDAAVLGVYSAGGETAVRYLERMLTRTEAFYDIYDCTQPVLIYMGNDICYHMLDIFSRELGRALEEMGQCVEYFDFSSREPEELIAYKRRRFKAVVGVQTYLFSLREREGSFLHDGINAPQYHFVLDHPIWMKEHLQQVPRRLCVLAPDGNYVQFVRNFYGHPARFLPPAGEEKHVGEAKRVQGISFLGRCGVGPVKSLWSVKNSSRDRCRLLNRYILYMRKNLGGTPEHAFQSALDYYGITCSREEFVELFCQERWVIHCLANHYKNKTVEMLLKAGIAVHVYGESWDESDMRHHPLLFRHQSVTEEEALAVYAKSKLSLNVMTWHKDGFTERIANAMLQKSVVVTDRTTYLEKEFTDGEEILLFDLAQLAGLPDRVKALLCDDTKRERIAEKGYRKASERHTWRQRAKTLLEFVEEDGGIRSSCESGCP